MPTEWHEYLSNHTFDEFAWNFAAKVRRLEPILFVAELMQLKSFIINRNKLNVQQCGFLIALKQLPLSPLVREWSMDINKLIDTKQLNDGLHKLYKKYCFDDHAKIPIHNTVSKDIIGTILIELNTKHHDIYKLIKIFDDALIACNDAIQRCYKNYRNVILSKTKK